MLDYSSKNIINNLSLLVDVDNFLEKNNYYGMIVRYYFISKRENAILNFIKPLRLLVGYVSSFIYRPFR